MQTQQTRHIPLSALRDGHEYPGAAINARLTGQTEGIDQLVASIRQEGLLQSLLVITAPDEHEATRGLYFVIDGNRRLTALQALATEGAIDGAFPVPAIIDVETNPLDALRKSLTANIEKLPLHPVDQHETFAKVHETGATPEEIAARYAVTVKLVRQRLALGRLSPLIRTAWRAGEITGSIAALFTVQPDITTQEKAFKRLEKKHKLRVHYYVQQELLGDANNANRYLSFVGREAYETQGGKIVEDLFSREDDEAPLYVSDSALLKKLVDHKLEEKCLALLAEGWSWAEQAGENSPHLLWEKLPVKGKKASAELKATSGCVVGIDRSGAFQIVYGLVKPAAKKAKEPKISKSKTATGNKKTEPEEPATISMGLRRALNAQLTKAIAKALQADSGVALAALVAGFASWGNGLIGVTAPGLDDSDRMAPEDFSTALEAALRQDTAALLERLAAVTAGALHIADVRSADALTQSLNSETVTQEISAAFDAQDYFASAPKALTLQAITETMGEQAAKPLLNKPKAAIAQLAQRELVKRGWLPPELRTPHYVVPAPDGTTPEPEQTEEPTDKPKRTKKAKA